MEGRNINREEEKNLTVQEILKAAAKLFFEHGYDNTSTRELAKAVGLSNAGIYYHFKGKEDILFHILNESTSELHRSVQAAVQPGADPQANLTRVVEVLVKAVVDQRIEIGILLQESNRLSPEQLAEINKKKTAVVDLVKDELAKLDQQGLLRETNLTVSAFALMGITNWTFYWYDPSGPLSIEELVERQMGIFFNGILKPV